MVTHTSTNRARRTATVTNTEKVLPGNAAMK